MLGNLSENALKSDSPAEIMEIGEKEAATTHGTIIKMSRSPEVQQKPAGSFLEML